MQFAQAHLRLVPCWTLASGLGPAVLGCSCVCPQTWAWRQLQLATPAPHGQSNVQASCLQVPGPHVGSFLGTARDRQPAQNAQPNGWSLTASPGNEPGVTLSASPRACPSPTTSPGNKLEATHSKIFPGPRPSPMTSPGSGPGDLPNFTPAAILASAQGNPDSAWAIARPGRPCKSTGSQGQMEDTPEAQRQSIRNSDLNPRLRGT